MIRKSLAFLAAASLAVSPALAAPSVSAPVSRAGPAAATSDLDGGASLFPIIVFAAIVVAGVLLATGVIFDDDHPTSP